eukprot:6506746-Ditylum_brightwellii.AAC.1
MEIPVLGKMMNITIPSLPQSLASSVQTDTTSRTSPTSTGSRASKTVSVHTMETKPTYATSKKQSRSFMLDARMVGPQEHNLHRAPPPMLDDERSLISELSTPTVDTKYVPTQEEKDGIMSSVLLNQGGGQPYAKHPKSEQNEPPECVPMAPPSISTPVQSNSRKKIPPSPSDTPRSFGRDKRSPTDHGSRKFFVSSPENTSRKAVDFSDKHIEHKPKESESPASFPSFLGKNNQDDETVDTCLAGTGGSGGTGVTTAIRRSSAGSPANLSSSTAIADVKYKSFDTPFKKTRSKLASSIGSVGVG